MATVIDSNLSQSNADGGLATKALEKNLNQDIARVPWLWLSISIVGIVFFFGAYRWYQHAYSFSVGLDYFEPAFQIYWMRLFWIQLFVIGTVGMIAAPMLWLTRPRDFSDLLPEEEIRRYFWVLSVLLMGGIIVYFAMDIYAEADAAWHQVTIRDTDFTPTHIVLFYMGVPLLGLVAILGFIWVHTRLPKFTKQVSLPLALTISGPLLIMPNLGFNEWGHTFFYAEELFAAPIHWGFVVLAWAFFGMTGFIVQCFHHISDLTDKLDLES